MLITTTKRCCERSRQRKITLFKKVYNIGREYQVDIAVIIYQNGQYCTFRSLDQKL
ncbi:hypothetical protein CJF32_00010809 [Rutstroemia sp. NJR-2017a WRK4]|nr:hypothetical protein CJF32_00010809 [Rutstroemia sp. NJR-2017a WRK4]